MSFAVLPYSQGNLTALLAAKTSPEVVNSKLHTPYFHKYLQDIDARSIVAEPDYIDHDYLEDYASYYVKCFHDYGKKCTRLHFFKKTFTREEFSEALLNANQVFLEEIKNSYLGFIVLKPLPKTIVGRTCLTTYPSANKRFYPITREYKTSLFGIDLVVKTLAYQEQDQVAAACATSALWSVFHGTGILFQHSIPTPIEITKAALEKSPAEVRNLPNKGLTLEQRGHAVRDVGLDPFLVKATDEYILKSTAYGYMRAEIPIYFSVELFDGQTSIGNHGVALTGYGLDNSAPRGLRTGFLLKASRIEKIYVHDDQIGPFAKMEFDGRQVTTGQGGRSIALPSLATSWFNNTGRAVPIAILIPLYHKIRIPYGIVHDMVLDFDAQIEIYRAQLVALLPERFEWDIFLSQVNKFKSEILSSSLVHKGIKEEILTSKFPKHLWRATALINNIPVIELLFDATDIEQGNIFMKCVVYNEDIYNLIVLMSKLSGFANNAIASKPVFAWFALQQPIIQNVSATLTTLTQQKTTDNKPTQPNVDIADAGGKQTKKIPFKMIAAVGIIFILLITLAKCVPL